MVKNILGLFVVSIAIYSFWTLRDQPVIHKTNNASLAEDSALVDSNSAVIQAYRAVPHRQTPYDPNNSNQSPIIARYFGLLFSSTDLALIERIEGLKNNYRPDLYRARITELENIEVPTGATESHALILSAIKEHDRFFSGGKKDSNLVRQSHQKLLKAYNIILKNYPDNAHNQQAYFDHLCALDFI